LPAPLADRRVEGHEVEPDPEHLVGDRRIEGPVAECEPTAREVLVGPRDGRVRRRRGVGARDVREVVPGERPRVLSRRPALDAAERDQFGRTRGGEEAGTGQHLSAARPDG